MEKFAIGLLMGSVIGAVCVANNYKIRTLVKKGQKEMQDKIDEMMYKNIDAVEEQDTKAETTEKTQKSKKSRAKKTVEA